MAPLTTQQRNKLPNSAFAYPATRKYPIPTKQQAKRAGISEAQRQTMQAAARSYAARKSTAGSVRHVNRVIARRK
jgi:hypothetical protein